MTKVYTSAFGFRILGEDSDMTRAKSEVIKYFLDPEELEKYRKSGKRGSAKKEFLADLTPKTRKLPPVNKTTKKPEKKEPKPKKSNSVAPKITREQLLEECRVNCMEDGIWVGSEKIYIGIKERYGISLSYMLKLIDWQGIRDELVGISIVDLGKIDTIIETRKPLGKFLARPEAGVYIACDNTTGDAWVKPFPSRCKSELWLNRNQMEGGDLE